MANADTVRANAPKIYNPNTCTFTKACAAPAPATTAAPKGKSGGGGGAAAPGAARIGWVIDQTAGPIADVAQEAINGITNTGTGLGHAATHPRETASGLKAAYDDPEGAVRALVKNCRDQGGVECASSLITGSVFGAGAGTALKTFAVAARTAAKGDAALAGSIRAANPLRGTQNCVNCVVAVDARLDGGAASALDSGAPQPISVLQNVYGARFRNVSGQGEIEDIMREAGPGARGIVYGGRSGGVGHVFNAVNQGGTVRFLDGRIGGSASFHGYDSFKFLPTNTP